MNNDVCSGNDKISRYGWSTLAHTKCFYKIDGMAGVRVLRSSCHSMFVIPSDSQRNFKVCIPIAIGCILYSLFSLTFLHYNTHSICRGPLLTYLGMEYGDIKLSPSRLKLTITDLELLPSRSSLIQSIFLSIFPSANVQRGNNVNIEDYPESKLTVSKLTIKIRVGSLADPCTTNSTNPHENVSDHDNKVYHGNLHTDDEETKRQWGLKSIYHLIPRPIIIIKLKDVSIEVEKAYLAPEPPSQLRAISSLNKQQLPLALPPPQGDNGEDNNNHLPTFAQDYFLNAIENEDVVEADKVTFFIERWSKCISYRCSFVVYLVFGFVLYQMKSLICIVHLS